jgi:hypothetical protein
VEADVVLQSKDDPAFPPQCQDVDAFALEEIMLDKAVGTYYGRMNGQPWETSTASLMRFSNPCLTAPELL